MKIYGVYQCESWSGGSYRSFFTTKSTARTFAIELVKNEQKELIKSRDFDKELGGHLNYNDFVESPYAKDEWIGGCNNYITISIEEIEVNE